jgi:hypothetical protein
VCWSAGRYTRDVVVYEIAVDTIVQSLYGRFFDVMNAALHLPSPSESAVIAMPSMPIRHASAAHSCPSVSLAGKGCNVAVKGGRFGSLLPVLLAVTTAVDGWLTVGPLAQSALMGAAMLRRLRRIVRTVLGGTSDYDQAIANTFVLLPGFVGHAVIPIEEKVAPKEREHEEFDGADFT